MLLTHCVWREVTSVEGHLVHKHLRMFSLCKNWVDLGLEAATKKTNKLLTHEFEENSRIQWVYMPVN